MRYRKAGGFALILGATAFLFLFIFWRAGADPVPLNAADLTWTTVAGLPVFHPTGTVGLSNCDLVVADGFGRRLIRIDPSGDSRTLVSLPLDVLAHYVRLQPLAGSEDELLAWGHPGFLATLNTRTNQLTRLSVPVDAWGRTSTGPSVSRPDSTLVMSRFVDPRLPILEPTDAPSAPLLEVISRDGEVLDTFGELEDRRGRTLTWANGRSVLLQFGDTVGVLSTTHAVLRRFVQGPRGFDSLPPIALPRYFRPTRLRERRIVVDELAGDVRAIPISQPHLTDATMGPDRRIYVVRNVEYRWRDPDIREPGGWEPVQSLEIYDTVGNLLSSHAIPANGRRGIRVDEGGRMFLYGLQVVSVAQSPFLPARCKALPRSIDIVTHPDSITPYSVAGDTTAVTRNHSHSH